jgi:hypothetical protein
MEATVKLAGELRLKGLFLECRRVENSSLANITYDFFYLSWWICCSDSVWTSSSSFLSLAISASLFLWDKGLKLSIYRLTHPSYTD